MVKHGFLRAPHHLPGYLLRFWNKSWHLLSKIVSYPLVDDVPKKRFKCVNIQILLLTKMARQDSQNPGIQGYCGWPCNFTIYVVYMMAPLSCALYSLYNCSWWSCPDQSFPAISSLVSVSSECYKKLPFPVCTMM